VLSAALNVSHVIHTDKVTYPLERLLSLHLLDTNFLSRRGTVQFGRVAFLLVYGKRGERKGASCTGWRRLTAIENCPSCLESAAIQELVVKVNERARVMSGVKGK